MVSARRYGANHRRRKRPETVVQECIDLLKREFNATVEEHSIREEQVYFALPRELRMLTTQPG